MNLKRGSQWDLLRVFATSFLLVFTLVTSSLLAAEDTILVSPTGKLYRLDNKNALVEIPLSYLESEQFKKPKGQNYSAGGNTEVTSDNKVLIQTGQQWIDSGLTPPPSGSYQRAHIDLEGNLFVELSGNRFLFKSGSGNLVIPPSRMEWASPPPNFKKILANPFGSGVMGLTEDGRLYKISIPTRTQRQFSAQQMTLEKPATDVVLHDSRFLVSNADGTLSTIENDLESPQIKQVLLPQKFPEGELKIFSSRSPLAEDLIILELDRQKRAAQAQAEPQRSTATVSNLKPGERIEKKGQEFVRVAADGTVTKAPVSVVASLEGVKAAEPFLSATRDVITDRLNLDRFLDREIPIFGRKQESQQVLDTLVRMKGKNPVLVGEAGTGKTAIAELVSQLINNNDLPEAQEYQRALKDAIVVQTTPAAISALAQSNADSSQQAAMESYIKSLKASEKILGRPIVLYIDEMHLLSKSQLEALKTSLDSKDGILFIGSTTHNEYGLMIGRNSALERRFQPIQVNEFSKEETRELLKEAVVPQLEKRYGGKNGPGRITDEAIDAAIQFSREYLPHSARPEGPFKLLQDAMIRAHREAKQNAPTLYKRDVGTQVAEALHLPFDPSSPQAIIEQTEQLKPKLRETVVDQSRVTDTMADLWRDVYLSPTGEKTHKIMLIAGPTGAGKTFSAQQFAKEVLGDEQRFLEIDGTKYNTGGLSLNSLIGAPPGVLSSDNFRGLLPEFLSGKGKGTNVIVINELDKANKDLMETLMEMMDTGKLQGGDGKTYHLGRSLIILTTNKGDEEIYPRDLGYIPSREEMEKRLSRFTDKDIKGFFMQPNRNNLTDREASQLPPSILGRIDAAVPAAPPSLEGAIKIAKQKAAKLTREHKELFNQELILDDSVLRKIVENVYVPEDGVRDVNRAVEKVFHGATTEAHTKLQAKPKDRLVLTLKPGNAVESDSFTLTHSNGSSSSLPPPTPRRRSQNPLKDEAQRERLQNLESNMGEIVLGQADAIRMVSRGLRNKAVNASDPRPATFLLLGRTGTGKTETGKAIARELYGNPEKLISFNMGEVKWEGDFNKIFGVNSGFVGSDKTSAFERFLQDHPEGGVIMFDEVGNMGGGTTAHEGSSGGGNTKTDLLMKFYQMIDEGKFRSPNSGKVYDLRKFSLVFTSNEGQEMTTAPNDDLSLSMWRDNNKLPVLSQMLKRQGWPEALLARLGSNITLYKPLIAEERVGIAKKLIEQTTEALKKQHGIKEVVVDPGFYRAVADSFFSHDQGARAMRNLADGALTDLIAQALFSDYDPNRLQNATFELGLKDSYQGKFRYGGNFPPSRKVELSLKVKTPGEKDKVYTSDISSEAAEKRLTRNRDLIATAFHEAGHAVVNDPTVTGMASSFITVRSAGNFGGYARSEIMTPKPTMTRKEAVAHIGNLLAGILGQRIMGIEDDSGWSSDIQRARNLAQEAVTTYGLTDGALNLPVQDGKVVVGSPQVQAEIQRLLSEGETYALQRLNERRALFGLLAKDLIRKGHVDKKRFEELENLAQSKPIEHRVLNQLERCRKILPRLK